MRHIVSFSTGLSSAITVERVLQKYGAVNTDIVFMDTTIEDEDNERFMRDLQKRWPPIVKLCEGRDPYQVAEDKHIIPNQKIAPCTFALKIEIFRDWLEKKYGELWGLTVSGSPVKVLNRRPVTIHIGYDYSEAHRCGPTEEAYNAAGWAVDFPLLWRPYEMRPYEQVSRDDWGIEPPRMYALGYTHANCGGRCVKQGQGDWLRTLINFPDRYAESEAWEQRMRQHPKRKDYAILRDRTGGTVTPLTLRELRERYEANRKLQPSLLDYHAPCVHCGVGDFIR